MSRERYNIGGVVYSVVDVDMTDNDGEIDYSTGIIKLAKRLAPSPRLATLRHEQGHGAFWQSGAKARLRRLLGNDLADEVEEDVLDRVLPVYHDIKRVK